MTTMTFERPDREVEDKALSAPSQTRRPVLSAMYESAEHPGFPISVTERGIADGR